MAATGKDEQESQHGFAARSKCSRCQFSDQLTISGSAVRASSNQHLASLLEWSLQAGAERGEDRTFHIKSNTSPLSISKTRIMCTTTIALAVWLREDNLLLWLWLRRRCVTAPLKGENRGYKMQSDHECVDGGQWRREITAMYITC